MTGMSDHVELILDGTKIAWHQDRIRAWERGERIAPITIDMALTRSCNFACHFWYAMLQENDRKVINKKVIFDFLEDCAGIGVKGISFVSDGESTISPVFIDACKRGHELGLSMAVGTNGFVLNRRKLEEVLPALTYVRINISAGERDRYAQIMGVKEHWFDRVCQNIRDMAEIKKRDGLPVTIGLQMVLMPEYEDQILPLARLGKELRPDYLVIKHCSDNEDGDLGVDYGAYRRLYDKLHEAEAMSDEGYQVTVKWSKIAAEGKRSYQRWLRRALHDPALRLRPGRALRHAVQRALQEVPHRQHLRRALQGHLVLGPLLGGDELPRQPGLQRPVHVRLALPAAQGQ